jgi:hypothetical protein
MGRKAGERTTPAVPVSVKKGYYKLFFLYTKQKKAADSLPFSVAASAGLWLFKA